MAEPISIQQLKDASLDVKSLEEVVNGDENVVVTTRLGETYPSVKGSIKKVFENGGFPATAFDTKDKMTTEGASLVDGDYAWVTDDTDTNNGLYIKKSGAWVLSEFNVLKRVQDYVKHLDAKVMFDDSVYLDISSDKNGEVYRYTDKDGGLHLTNLPPSKSVQQSINEVMQTAPIHQKDGLLSVKVDSSDTIYSFYDADANLHLANDIYIKGGKVGITSLFSGNDIRYQNILMHRYGAVKALTPIDTKLEDGLNKRMPFGIVTPTGLVVFYHKQVSGYDGDGSGSELWKAIITIDETLTATVVSRELFLATPEPVGVVKHPMLGRTSDGRILLVYETGAGNVSAYTRYQCYSSDEGITFTAATPLTPSGINPAGLADVNLGSGGLILTAKNNRLILPMFTQAGTAYVAYSDDDGASWTYSSYIRPIGAGHEPSVSLDMNDNIIMDTRPRTVTKRVKAISKDNGETWYPYETEVVDSARNQGTINRDKNIGALIQTHNNTTANVRNKYTLSFSYDNGMTYPFKYQPFSDDWYGGYSQLLKWRDGVYILVIEYADRFLSVNANESSGIIILTLNEVLKNVRYN